MLMNILFAIAIFILSLFAGFVVTITTLLILYIYKKPKKSDTLALVCISIPLTAGQWNEITSYGVLTPIATALASIPNDVEITIWASSGKSTQGYKSNVPAWACDLDYLAPGMTYIIKVSKDTSLALSGASLTGHLDISGIRI